jgi:hypothetical protein
MHYRCIYFRVCGCSIQCVEDLIMIERKEIYTAEGEEKEKDDME